MPSLLYALFTQVFDEDGFIADLRNQSSEIQAVIDEYGTPMLVKIKCDQGIFDCQ